MIPLLQPSIAPNTKKYINDVIDSHWWGLGPKTEEFEKRFAEYVGAKYAVGVNSATSALHLALIIQRDKLKKKYNSKITDVITTPLTFISSALIAEYENLFVKFADINSSLNIDIATVKEMIKEKDIFIPVHYGGRNAFDENDDLSWLDDDQVIQDCAHACGTKNLPNKGLKIWSFHAVKNLPTGDGGMITTDSKEDYERLKALRWVGINKSTYERAQKKYGWDYNIQEVGYKYHMNDLTASIGLAQLEVVEKHNERRKELVKNYNNAFKDINQIITPQYDDNMSWHLYVVRLNEATEEQRNRFIDYFT
jgi:perosamine synthetase